MDVHARILFYGYAALARFAHHAHGEPPGHDGVRRLDGAAPDAQFGRGKQYVGHLDFRLRRRLNGFVALFGHELFRGRDLPDSHNSLRGIPEKESLMVHYTPIREILQAF